MPIRQRFRETGLYSLVLPNAGTYLLWGSQTLTSTGQTAGQLSCELFEGKDYELSPPFNTTVPVGATITVPLSGFFIVSAASTYVTVQCSNTAGDVLASGGTVNAIQVQ